MSTIISLLTGPNTIFAALFGAIVLAVISYVKGRLTGAKLEKAEQAKERLEARDEAAKIDQAVAGMTDEEVIKEQAKWSRPKR